MRPSQDMQHCCHNGLIAIIVAKIPCQAGLDSAWLEETSMSHEQGDSAIQSLQNLYYGFKVSISDWFQTWGSLAIVNWKLSVARSINLTFCRWLWNCKSM